MGKNSFLKQKMILLFLFNLIALLCVWVIKLSSITFYNSSILLISLTYGVLLSLEVYLYSIFDIKQIISSNNGNKLILLINISIFIMTLFLFCNTYFSNSVNEILNSKIWWLNILIIIGMFFVGRKNNPGRLSTNIKLLCIILASLALQFTLLDILSFGIIFLTIHFLKYIKSTNWVKKIIKFFPGILLIFFLYVSLQWMFFEIWILLILFLVIYITIIKVGGDINE